MRVTGFLRRLYGKLIGVNINSLPPEVRFSNPDYQLSTSVHQVADHQGAENQRIVSLIPVLSGEKIRLVFLVITPELWSSVEPLWERSKMDNRFIVTVVVLKSTSSDISLSSLSKAQAYFDAAGISYFTEDGFSFQNSRAHVVFYPLPYSSLYPDRYKPEVAAAMGCRIAYIPYGLEVGGGVFNARYQYDTEVPRVAWRVYARSLGQLKSFSRYCSYGNGHVVLTGHPRTERNFHQGIRSEDIQISKVRGRSVILWTPHFTVNTRRKWSSFLDYHETIVRMIDERPDLFLLVRPHPFLKASLAKHESWGGNCVSNWFSNIDEKDNMHVDTAADYRHAFEISSAIMADAGSFLVEYLLTGKPVCYLTGKDDIGLSQEVRSLGCYYSGATELDLDSFLDRVVRKGEDSLSEARNFAVKAYFGADNPIPSQAILEDIIYNSDQCALRPCSSNLPLSQVHDVAYQYWLKATSTHLAPEAYYQAQEDKLREILIRHAKGRFAVDIGCGNGRFTQIISAHFEFTEATDPNMQLINEAREHADEAGIANISYSIERLEHAETLSTYDFVSCMGVTSGLVDDEVFIKSIWKLKAAMRPGAVLLVKDSLSLTAPEMINWNGYTAVYRNATSYTHAFQTVGLNLVEEILITQDVEKNRINSFYVFSECNGSSS